MINDAINISHFRQMLVRNSRVQIPDFLQPDAAETLRQCLLTEIPWAMAERSGGQSHTIAAEQYSAMSDQQRAQLMAESYEKAKNEFQFSYDSYMMVKAVKEG